MARREPGIGRPSDSRALGELLHRLVAAGTGPSSPHPDHITASPVARATAAPARARPGRGSVSPPRTQDGLPRPTTGRTALTTDALVMRRSEVSSLRRDRWSDALNWSFNGLRGTVHADEASPGGQPCVKLRQRFSPPWPTGEIHRSLMGLSEASGLCGPDSFTSRARCGLGRDWRARPPAVLEIGPVLPRSPPAGTRVGNCRSWNRGTTPSSIRLLRPSVAGGLGRTVGTRHTASTAVGWRTCADGCGPGLPRSPMNGSTRSDPAVCVDQSAN